jgi:hypothetical protein
MLCPSALNVGIASHWSPLASGRIFRATAVAIHVRDVAEVVVDGIGRIELEDDPVARRRPVRLERIAR